MPAARPGGSKPRQLGGGRLLWHAARSPRACARQCARQGVAVLVPVPGLAGPSSKSRARVRTPGRAAGPSTNTNALKFKFGAVEGSLHHYGPATCAWLAVGIAAKDEAPGLARGRGAICDLLRSGITAPAACALCARGRCCRNTSEAAAEAAQAAELAGAGAGAGAAACAAACAAAVVVWAGGFEHDLRRGLPVVLFPVRLDMLQNARDLLVRKEDHPLVFGLVGVELWVVAEATK